MSKKISIEIRQKVLTLLKQGARSFTISKQLGLARISVENWQAAFDRGDVSWSLDNSWRKRTEAMAWQAVRGYAVCQSYNAAGCALGMSASDVRRYVQNVEKFGAPILKRGVRCQAPEIKNMPDKTTASRGKENVAKELKTARRTIEEQRIVLDCLLKSIDEHLGSKKNNVPSLIRQLRAHIAAGYPLPELAKLQVPAGAPFTAVLEILVKECSRLRLLAIASKCSKNATKDDMASEG